MNNLEALKSKNTMVGLGLKCLSKWHNLSLCSKYSKYSTKIYWVPEGKWSF